MKIGCDFFRKNHNERKTIQGARGEPDLRQKKRVMFENENNE